MNYYNENDPKAAAWLRALSAAGHIAPGHVDERSILDVTPNDLRGYTQCHFFAGIGVWSYALRRAGWPDDEPVWTGSCPCQSFSAAGKGAGFADERHLWPAWFHLIRECRPSVVFGEQVEAAIRFGWLDLVHSDLEGEGYAVGAAGIPAAGVGAPHIRQRLWFVGEREDGMAEPYGSIWRAKQGHHESARSECGESIGDGDGDGSMAESGGVRWQRRQGAAERRVNDRADAGRLEGDHGASGGGEVGPVKLADTSESRRQSRRRTGESSDGRGASRLESGRLRDGGGMANDASHGRQQGVKNPQGVRGGDSTKGESGRSPKHGDISDVRLADTHGGDSSHGDLQRGGQHGQWEEDSVSGWSRDQGLGDRATGELGPGPTNGYWAAVDWLFCRDGKWRPVESSPQQMVDGSSESLGRLRAETVAKAEEAVDACAMEAQVEPVTLLRDLQATLEEEAKRSWPVGGLPGLHEAPLLLAFLRQLSIEGWRFAEGLPLPCPEVASPELRSLWIQQATASASCKRELERQQPGEYPDPVHSLSLVLARLTQEAWGCCYEAYAEIGFPLGRNGFSRVSRLRGYGNAICAPAAQGFIESYLEGRAEREQLKAA